MSVLQIFYKILSGFPKNFFKILISMISIRSLALTTLVAISDRFMVDMQKMSEARTVDKINSTYFSIHHFSSRLFQHIGSIEVSCNNSNLQSKFFSKKSLWQFVVLKSCEPLQTVIRKLMWTDVNFGLYTYHCSYVV